MIAWLIEWPATEDRSARWWHPERGWTMDAARSLWFVRKEDAQASINKGCFVGGVRPVEHKWIGAAAAAQGDAANQNEAWSVEVAACRLHEGDWRVEAVHDAGEGEIHLTIFNGPEAEGRARAYAASLPAPAPQAETPSAGEVGS